MAVRWGDKTKMITAGDTVSTWQATARSAGMLIDQINVTIAPDTTVVFEWVADDSPQGGQFTMRTV